MSVISNFISRFKTHLPLLVVIAVGLIIASQNIDPNTYYTGWDNIHGEFNIQQYAQKVFTGAWLEHQGPGAPAGLAYLSELTRLPILLLLDLFLPDNLVRYTFIFTMYIIGGVGMYQYLSKVWLTNRLASTKNWLAALGGVFYLLHVLTLQQFYISFELFTIQFALLPFLLLNIHRLARSMTARNILIFVGLQLLLAPSGHTPTLFYLGTLFSLAYAFTVAWQRQGLLKGIRFSFIIGIITFITNAHWIIPNLYYSLHNSHYVQESRENTLFAPESIWSIREASTYENFISSTHYLFTWKDYSFADREYQYIFDEWLPHFSQPHVTFWLETFGKITFVGVVATMLVRRQRGKRFAIVGTYLACATFIWIELFPTNPLFDFLYHNRSFQEAFRNPVTKLSVIYSFLSIVLFIQVFAQLSLWLNQRKLGFITGRAVNEALIAIMFFAIGYTAWPAFQGHLISESLKVKYPRVYQEMFSYLQTRDKNLRVLPLPYVNHVGWEYYDWSFLGEGNGYQGMGFYFFGMPQAVLNRDSDRWVETSDFFSYELEQAVNSRDAKLFEQVLTKYQVDLVIIDQTKIKTDHKEVYPYQLDHQLVSAAGLDKVWEREFLTVYERRSPSAENSLLLPPHISLVTTNAERVRADYAYQHNGDYILTTPDQASAIYPMIDLTSSTLSSAEFTDQGITLTRPLPEDNHTLTVPGIRGRTYVVPATISHQSKTVSVTFPSASVAVGGETHSLPQIENFTFDVKDPLAAHVIFFNDLGIVINPDQTVQPILTLTVDKPIAVSYLTKAEDFEYTDEGNVNLPNAKLTEVKVINPDWNNFKSPLLVETNGGTSLTVSTRFPVRQIDLAKRESKNCSVPQRGSVSTSAENGRVIYEANDFGVNCVGYDFIYESPAYSYLLDVTGKNHQGRGIKLFVSSSDASVVPADYVFTNNTFHQVIPLQANSSDPREQFFINWEVRSFGKKSQAQLDSMRVGVFPIEQIAQISLTKQPSISKPADNQIKIIAHHEFMTEFHLVKYHCDNNPCYLGLDQSFDDAWIALRLDNFELVPHLKLNSWANLWEVEDDGTLVIIYLPQLAAIICMIGVMIFMSALIIKKRKRPKTV